MSLDKVCARNRQGDRRPFRALQFSLSIESKEGMVSLMAWQKFDIYLKWERLTPQVVSKGYVRFAQGG